MNSATGLTPQSAIQKLKCWRHLSFHERGVLVTSAMQNRQSRFCANLEQSILKSLRLADSYERILITVDDSESGQHLGGRQVGGYVPLRRQPIFRAEPYH